jgi:hypothetical protein
MRACSLLLVGFLVLPTAARAYRPFDSTDPAVAGLGEAEIEFSPVSSLHDADGQSWIAPSLRLNYGFAKNWEVVLEGEALHSARGPGRLEENALSLKTVLREGSLQDKNGVSLAAEAGLLLPGVNGQPGAGVSIAGIAGQRWDWGSVDINVAAGVTRDNHAELFLGTILEGPHSWPLRPVAELTYTRQVGTGAELGALAGAIWQASDTLSFDFGVRRARMEGLWSTEVRAGLTLSIAGL